MSNYIPADKLLAEIQRRKQQDITIRERSILIDIETAIESLQRELQQGHPSLPANLDEAAEKYSENILANNEDLQDAIEDAFKEGAEWMAKQGVTVGGTFHHSRAYPSVIELKTYLREYEGADVIVQVRKK